MRMKIAERLIWGLKTFSCIGLAGILLITGCELIHTPPQINDVDATTFRLNSYDRTTLTCDATDAEGDELSYSWKATGGHFIGSRKKAEVIWQAPNIAGYYDITVTVDDIYDESSHTTTIVVAESFNFITIPGGYLSYGEGDTALIVNTGFDMMKYEVTNEQFAKYLEEALSVGEISVSSNVVSGYYTGDANFQAGTYNIIDMQTDDCRISYDGISFSVTDGYENHPVVMVTWFGAYAYATHYGMKLPTEMQWELAARSNTGYDYPWGNDLPICDQANYFGCEDDTQPVGNATGVSVFGVYDLAGNVWEWTNSFFNSTVTHRVRRGGGYNNLGEHLTSWYRYYSDPTGTYPAIGFRCIRTN